MIERKIKEWGIYETYARNEVCTVKLITVNAGEGLSLQSHKLRDEEWTFITGGGVVTIDDMEMNVSSGDMVYIKAGQKHRFVADVHTIFLEIAKGDVREDDIERYADFYGRAPPTEIVQTTNTGTNFKYIGE